MKLLVFSLTLFVVVGSAKAGAFTEPSPPKDYIITQSGDTTYGHIKRWGVFFGYRLKLVTNTEVVKYRTRELYEYYIGGKRPRLYMNLSYPNHRGKMMQRRFLTLQDGPMRLLVETDADNDDHVVLYQGKVYVIRERYFSDELWAILIRCEAFQNKYGGYREENLNKFFINVPKQERIWREMVAFYNAQCL